MKRQNRFLIGLLSASITFSVLYASFGTDHWRRGYWHHGHGYYHHHDKHEHWDRQDKPDGTESQEDIPEQGS